MDSSALQTFLAVHRQGGISAATDTLARTQSAISRRLALLEDELGAPLFDRVGRALVLSAVGCALLPHAERVVAAVGDARAAAEAAKSGKAGTLHLVTVGTLANAALTASLRQVHTRFPGLDLRLQTATSDEVSALVRSGAATIGLRYFHDRSPDLDCQPVHEERLVVVCAPTHPLAGRRVAGLHMLADQRWLAFPVHERRGEAHAATLRAQFLTRGVSEIDVVPIDGLTAQKRLVEAGHGLALLQTTAIEEELAQRRLALVRVADLDARVPVTRVVRRGSYLSGAAQALLKTLARAGSSRARR